MKNTKKASKKTAQKSVAKTNKEATGKALLLALDVEQNHNMRASAADKGVDMFAAHSETHCSKAYLAQMLSMDRAELFKATKDGEVRLLVINGVANWIRLDAAGNFYGRNGRIAVRDFEDRQAIYGNLDSLRALYGNRVQLLTEQDVRKLYNAQKETVTRTIGNGKAKLTVTGRVIAQGSKGNMTLTVVVTETNGKLLAHNCEDRNNTYNAAHRYVQEKQNVVKAA